MPATITTAIAAFSQAVSGAVLAVTGSVTAANFALGFASLGLNGIGAAATVGGLVSTSLVTAGVSALATPQVADTGAQISTKVGSVVSLNMPMGRTLIGGVLAHDSFNSGKDDGMVTQTYILSGVGPCGVVEAVKIDDDIYSLSSASASGVQSVVGHEAIWIIQKPGGWDQTAINWNAGGNGMAAGDMPSEWTTNHRLCGCMHVQVVVARFNEPIKSNGLGSISFIVNANQVELIDPRTMALCTTDAQRRNPYVWAYNWARDLIKAPNGQVFSCGYSVDDVDTASFAYGANIADANELTIGGNVEIDPTNPHEVLSAMLQAGGGSWMPRNGKIYVTAPVIKAVSGYITDDDLRDEITIQPLYPVQEVPNRIIPRFLSETNSWTTTDGTAVTDTSLQEEDGAQRSQTLEISYCGGDAAQAAKIAALALMNAREPHQFDVPLMPRARYKGFVGDCLQFSGSLSGFNGQKILIDSLTGNADLTCDIHAVSETDAKYDWAFGKTTEIPDFYATAKYDKSQVATPTAASWSVIGTSISQDNSTVPCVKVSGSASEYAGCGGVTIEYKPTDGDTWYGAGDLPATTSGVEITSVTPQTSYDVRIAYYNNYGVQGDWYQATAVTTGNLVAGEASSVDWTNVVDDTGTKPADNANETYVDETTGEIGGVSGGAGIVVDNSKVTTDSIGAATEGALNDAEQLIQDAQDSADDALEQAQAAQADADDLISGAKTAAKAALLGSSSESALLTAISAAKSSAEQALSDAAAAQASVPNYSSGTAEPTSTTEPEGSIYLQKDSAGEVLLIWIFDGSAWQPNYDAKSKYESLGEIVDGYGTAIENLDLVTENQATSIESLEASTNVQPNLLLNPSGSQGMDGWYYTENISVREGPAARGNYFGADSGTSFSLSQKVRVNAGYSYSLQAAASSSAVASTVQVRIYWWWLDSSSNILGNSTDIAVIYGGVATADLKVENQVAPEGAVYAMVTCDTWSDDSYTIGVNSGVVSFRRIKFENNTSCSLYSEDKESASLYGSITTLNNVAVKQDESGKTYINGTIDTKMALTTTDGYGLTKGTNYNNVINSKITDSQAKTIATNSLNAVFGDDTATTDSSGNVVAGSRAGSNLVNIVEASDTFATASQLEELNSAVGDFTEAEYLDYQETISDELGSQSQSLETLEASSVNPVNQLVNSDLTRGTYGFGTNAYWKVGVNQTVDEYFGKANVISGYINGYLADGVEADVINSLGRSWLGGSLENAQKFSMSVKQGDRVWAMAKLAYHRLKYAQLYALVTDYDGNLVSAPSWTSTAGKDASGHGDASNFDLVGGVFDITATNAAFMQITIRAVGASDTDSAYYNPYVFVRDMAMGKALSNQTSLPSYSPGPVDKTADNTSENAAFIEAQGAITNLNNVAVKQDESGKTYINGLISTSMSANYGLNSGTDYNSLIETKVDESGAKAIASNSLNAVFGSGTATTDSSGNVIAGSSAGSNLVNIVEASDTFATASQLEELNSAVGDFTEADYQDYKEAVSNELGSQSESLESLEASTNIHPNLLSNPTGALGLSGWTYQTGCAVSPGAGEGYYYYYTGGINPGFNQRISIIAGGTYSLQGRLFAASMDTTAKLRLYISWRDSSGTAVGASTIGQIYGGNSWTDIKLPAQVAPSSAAYAQVTVDILNLSAALTSNVAWQRLKLEQGDNCTLYTDDASANTLQGQITNLNNVTVKQDATGQTYINGTIDTKMALTTTDGYGLTKGTNYNNLISTKITDSQAKTIASNSLNAVFGDGTATTDSSGNVVAGSSAGSNLVNIVEATNTFATASQLEELNSAVGDFTEAEYLDYQDTISDELGSQSQSLETLEASSVNPVNQLVNSDLTRGTYGFGTDSSWTVGVNQTDDAYYGKANVISGYILGYLADGVEADVINSLGRNWLGGSLENAQKFGMAVKQGDRVWAMAKLAYHRLKYVQLWAIITDYDGTLVQAPSWTSTAGKNASGHGDASNFDLVGGVFDITATNAAFMQIMIRAVGASDTDSAYYNPYVFVRDMAMGKALSNQTSLPSYSPGPVDKTADNTSENAAFIEAQGAITNLQSTKLDSAGAQALISTNLSSYYTITQVDNTLGNYYTISDADAKFLTQTNAASTYSTITQYNTLSANFDNYYTKTAADAKYLTIATAGDTYATASALTTLETEVGENTSAISEQAGSISDLEDSSAYWNLVASASGSDPAVMSLKNGKNGSAFDLIVKVFKIWNSTLSGTIEVMRAVGGYVFFSNPISIDVGSYRVTLGPNSNAILWYGAKTISPPAQTIANSVFALASDGKIYYGTTQLVNGGAAKKSVVIGNDNTANGMSNNTNWQTIKSITLNNSPAGILKTDMTANGGIYLQSFTGNTMSAKFRILVDSTVIGTTLAQDVISGGGIGLVEYDQINNLSYAVTAGNHTVQLQIQKQSGDGVVTAFGGTFEAAIYAS